MFRNALRALIVTYFIVTLAACTDRPQSGTVLEHVVYEALFLEIVGDAVRPYFVAQATESRWFENNPIAEVNWRRLRRELGNIDHSLVVRLYEVNTKSYSLEWNPLITSAEFLPGEYAQVDPKSGNDYCFVDEPTDIGIALEGRGFYRPYYTTSRVAFSGDNTIALIKVSLHCAPLSGGGEFFAVFENRGGRWTLVASTTLWIS